jgi:hypothetical protein
MRPVTPAAAFRKTHMQRSSHLRADCGQCCALCCVAPSFEAEQGFGFSKPAHVACRHLQADFRCSIHAELHGLGFPACSTFDCFGAGQRVTQRLFGGKSWTDSPELAMRMFHAYSRYRALHELLAMLELTAASVLPSDRGRLAQQLQSLESLGDSGEALSDAISLEALRREVLREIRTALHRAQSSRNPLGHDAFQR